jgi:hypothetical protein
MPGNSHWQPGVTAVFMFARLAAISVSIAANGGDRGWRAAEPDGHLVVVGDDVVQGELGQPGDGLA